MLGLSIYLAGEMRLSCTKTPPSASVEVNSVGCEAVERRILGLVTLQNRTYAGVSSATVESPALGRSEYWLSLSTSDGSERVLAGGQARTEKDVSTFNDWLQGNGEVSLELKRSAAPWALGTALFGCIWIFVISLIMREFLGYHTPWWWRVLGRRPNR